nr:unnamed protein product [Spirometra erinaceieuropaei]
MQSDVMDLDLGTIELLLQDFYDETKKRLKHTRILQLLKFCVKMHSMFDRPVNEEAKISPVDPAIPGLLSVAVLKQSELMVF